MSSLPVEHVFSTGRLAEWLSVSRNQIVSAIKKRIITPTKINGRWALTGEHAQILQNHFVDRMISKELSIIPRDELFGNHFERRRQVVSNERG